MRPLLLALAVASLLAGCAGPQPGSPREAAAPGVDPDRLMSDLRVLAADSMEGRRVGTEGGARARRFLLASLERVGLEPPGAGGFAAPFTFVGRDGTPGEGVNLIGVVRGTRRPEQFLVLTAHYDHLGVREGEIFNGADDNASGSAALLELARHFVRRRPESSIVFAWLDAEETGLRGARAFVADPPVAREAIVLNVNLDMVGRNARGELFAAGTHHAPFLRPYLERAAADAPVTLRFGHDSPELGSGDWTMQSDHGAFHEAGIPFVYFGVEDHPDYHRPTDDAERIEPGFFAGAVRTILRSVEELDRALPAIAAARQGTG